MCVCLLLLLLLLLCELLCFVSRFDFTLSMMLSTVTDWLLLIEWDRVIGNETSRSE